MKQYRGMAAAMLSAFFYGLSHVMVRITYDGGATSFTVIAMRMVFAAPVLLVIMKAKRIPFAISGKQARDLLLAGVFGSATTLLLYGSYAYISVGLSTTLHFVYPVVVMLGCVVFFKQKVSGNMVVALVLGLAGVALFFEGTTSGSLAGLIMSLASAFTYAIYMFVVERSSLRHMHFFKISFYFCIFQSGTAFLIGGAAGELNFDLTPMAWLFTALVGLLVSVGAGTLFQMGIILSGAAKTGIVSILEPITAVALGILLLGEQVTWMKILGMVAILSGIVIMVMGEKKEAAPPEEAPPPVAQ